MFLSGAISKQSRGPGRIGQISKESYEKSFEKYRAELIVDGEIAKLGSDVFRKIATELKIKSNQPEKVVQSAFKRYLEKKNGPIATKEKNESDSSSNQSDAESDFTLFDSEFKIHQNDLSYDVDIKNIGLFAYSDNEMKSQSEWSDTVNEIIWNFSRLPCAWRFDKHRNVANEKVIFGTCRSVECKANLFVYTECNQSKLKIVIKNFNPDAVHIEKRALKNSNKQKVAEMLKLNKPSYVHAEIANEMLESTDYCPAHLPNKSTLRKLKQRENEKNYRDPDPVRALCLLKEDSKFQQSITDIGLDPFYCFFSTPEQREWLRLSTRYRRCIISVDSTGNLFEYFFDLSQSMRTHFEILTHAIRKYVR